MRAAKIDSPACCLDCGEHLIGHYCHACGQSSHVHRTLAAWWHDFTHGVLHIEGTVWRTIAMLAVHPGQLTRRYIEGQRRRFLSPLALYLFTVFLLYVAYSVFGGFANVTASGRENTDAAMTAQAARVDQAIGIARQRRTAELASGQNTQSTDRQLERLNASSDDLARARTAVNRALDESTINGGKPLTITGLHWFDSRVTQAVHEPELTLFKMEANGYKFSWALIPLSLPFMWILFIRRREFFMFDHAVFVTYSLSSFSLLMTTMIVWNRALHLPGVWLATIIMPLHLYAQLRGGYGLNTGSALIRTVLVLIIAGLTLAVWMLLILLLGLAH